MLCSLCVAFLHLNLEQVTLFSKIVWILNSRFPTLFFWFHSISSYSSPYFIMFYIALAVKAESVLHIPYSLIFWLAVGNRCCLALRLTSYVKQNCVVYFYENKSVCSSLFVWNFVCHLKSILPQDYATAHEDFQHSLELNKHQPIAMLYKGLTFFHRGLLKVKLC